MNLKNESGKINYIEMPANDLVVIKSFFTAVFGFIFTDYGPEYTAFSAKSAGLDGGFFQTPLKSNTENGSALVVLYSDNLTQTLAAVEDAKGIINKPIFEFPGGRRFHFLDPCGNEWAVWSDT